MKQQQQNNTNSLPQNTQKTIQQTIRQIQYQIFSHTHLQNQYQVNQILLNSGEIIKTIFIKSNCKNDNIFYLGHGFGGTSLMYFPLFSDIIQKGSIVLWEIRGMGLGRKQQYSQQSLTTHDEGLQAILNYYQHKKITFISHSFGAYITMNFILRNSHKYQISKCILLSPIGVTPKEKDYKSKINSLIDVFHHAISWVGWKFNLTYKSILKVVGHSLKLKLIKNNFEKFQLQQKQLHKMVNLFDALTKIPGGSQKYFYKSLQPRVIPKQNKSIQQLIQEHKTQVKIVCFYGGKSDWVDKQGAKDLSQKYHNFQMKVLQQCGHMLPLHTKTIKSAIIDEISKNF